MAEPQLVYYPQTSDANHITIYYCGWEACKKGYTYGPAIRNHYLIHFIVRGKGSCQVTGAWHPVKAGQLFIVNPYVASVYQADIDDPWEYYWLGFDGGESADLIASAGFTSDQIVVSAPNPDTITGSLYQMSSLYTQEAPNRLMLLSHFYRFFAELGQHSGQKAEAHRYVPSAIQYIYNNYAYPITIGEIAGQLGINRSYLYKLFMEQRGISPQQYLINHRLFVACEMLRTSRYSINEIAYSCGFNTPTHFYNLFKAHYGKTPLQYKKTLDNGNTAENNT